MTDAPITRAMVLAAGYGTRLRPMTDELPKPLVPVMGRPLLERIVHVLACNGVADVVINTHHRAEAVRAWAAARDLPPRVELVHEPEILGTGGALANVRDRFAGDEAFLLHNGDVWADTDIRALIEDHVRGGAEITLLLVDRAAVNTVLVDDAGVVKDVGGMLGADGAPGDRRLTYTGVAVVTGTFLDRLPAGPSHLATALAAAMADRLGTVRGFAPRRLDWCDLGTPHSYLSFHGWMMRGEGMVLRGDDVRTADDFAPEGFCVLGDGCRLESGVKLRDCVVMPGVRVAGPVEHVFSVVGDGWILSGERPAPIFDGDLRSFLDGEGYDGARATPLAGQGSDRRFWRVESADASAVLMDSRDDPSEFSRSLAVAGFLHEAGLGGAKILARDEERRLVLQEDLGDLTLGEALRREPRAWRDLYGRVLDLLADLQARGTAAAVAGACPEAVDRLFGRDDLRAETRYFHRRFLEENLYLQGLYLDGLADEYDVLADLVAAQPAVLMHRDFQSTNILLRDGAVRLVDVQGMRLGPRGYDAASLLRDPYVDLDEARYDALLDRWCALVPDVAPATLRREVALAGLQRNMQALGAYAYLSRVKERRGFARWFAPGLRRLAAGLDAVAALDDPPLLPRLRAVVADLLGDDTRAD